ncbi:MAG: DUF1684 domain-containing protein [Cyclobacteriaceae bacterium]|jgi:uncharacterized protein (DUF1684 family)|nr:DUF1684 domain-containing protein [Cyclobacteriaceae bacterium]
MKSKNIILIVIAICIISIVLYNLTNNKTSESYKLSIEKERKEKDDFMRNSSESPFADSVSNFKGLQYFSPDEKYRIVAQLKPIENKKTIQLGTSDGLQKTYLEYATAEFTIDNKKCSLLILEMIDMGPFRGTLFLAFADATSANETYGAGRYLDIKKVPGSTSITLDFNKAYNPYCAYNDSFSCPFPPQQNILDVAIIAGEKRYQ